MDFENCDTPKNTYTLGGQSLTCHTRCGQDKQRQRVSGRRVINRYCECVGECVEIRGRKGVFREGAVTLDVKNLNQR